MTVLDNDDVKGLHPDAFELDTATIRDIAPEVLGQDGRMKVLPASFWAATTAQERALFGHRNGLYGFPTVELVERLKDMIAGRSAIEIGAGHGVLAQALNIPATDSRQQEMPKYKLIYQLTKQPTVPYGLNIVEMHASRAVREYKPDVVIGSWVTHKYDPAHHDRGGNEMGIDGTDILSHCREFILIGNEKIHAYDPLWKYPHQIEFPDYVYSRAQNGTVDFIARFRGRKK